MTRDNVLFSWLAVVVAIAGYFATGGDPRTYTFQQWMQAIVAIGGIIAAKLGTSPLPGAPSSNTVKLSTGTLSLLLVLGLTLGATSCASLGGARHKATVSVVSAHAVLAAVQDTEMGLVCGKTGAPAAPACVPVETHRQISAKLATAFEYEGKVAKIVRALPPGETSADIPTLIGQIRALMDAVLALIPKSAQRDALVANIGGA